MVAGASRQLSGAAPTGAVASGQGLATADPYPPNVTGMEILEVHLEASAARINELRSFYADALGFVDIGGSETSMVVGASRLTWRVAASEREPFYHFALLVPGQRFAAALAWVGQRVDLLELDGDPVVRFEDWNAQALYFHDPAGSIVELIAHLDIVGPACASAPFDASELLGVSEIGLVVQDKRHAATALRAAVGVELWPAADDLALDDTHDLSFLGRKAHTLILTSPGRGWLPTARPAEVHPVDVVLAGTGAAGRVSLPGAVVVHTG